MLADIGIAPVWYYKNGKNIITVSAERKRKISDLQWILIALILGFGLGFLSRLFPDALVHTAAQDVLAPLSNTTMSFLSAMAVLLIFFSVITGICGMGDMSTFQRIGKKMIAKLMLWLLISTLLIFAILTPFFSIVKEGKAGFDGGEIYTMLLDIVPDNVITPFATGNTMQVIFLSICIGVTMLVLNLKVSGLLSLFTQLTDLTQRIVMAIIKLLPLVVFISIFRLVALRQLASVSSVYRYPLLLLLADTVLLGVSLLRVSLTKKVSPVLLIKKLLPTLTIAVTTSSSVAAFTSNVEVCRKKLGIRRDLVDVGIPLGQVIFMPGGVADIICTTLCMAHLYGTPLTISRLVTLALITFILTIAAPPLPGAGISCYMLTMTQLGLPQKKQGEGFGTKGIRIDRSNRYARCHVLKCKTKDLLTLAKRSDASPAAVIPPLFSMALRECMEEKRDVRFRIVVDARAPLGHRTVHNCIFGKAITYIDRFDDMDFELVSTIYRAILQLAVERENVIVAVTNSVESLKKVIRGRSEALIRLRAKLRARSIKTSTSDVTFSNVGKVDYGEEINSHMKDFSVAGWTDYGYCTIVAAECNGIFTMMVNEAYQDNDVVPRFIRLAAERGLEICEVACYTRKRADR